MASGGTRRRPGRRAVAVTWSLAMLVAKEQHKAIGAETLQGVAEFAVPALAAGSISSGATSLMLPSNTATGIYYVIAQADGAAAVPERTAVHAVTPG